MWYSPAPRKEQLCCLYVPHCPGLAPARCSTTSPHSLARSRVRTYHCLSGPCDGGCSLLLLPDPDSLLGRCQTMTAAPSHPFLSVGCSHQLPWSGDQYPGTGTRRHSHIWKVLHANVQWQQARGGPKPSLAAALPMPQAAEGPQMFPLPHRVYGGPPPAEQTPSTDLPFTNQCSPCPSCTC